jgi:uncharacterized protein YggT (Ycf19 family)
MKKNLPSASIIIFFGLYGLINMLWFQTDGYQEAMKYIKWAIIIISFLLICSGFLMLFKKNKSHAFYKNTLTT